VWGRRTLLPHSAVQFSSWAYILMRPLFAVDEDVHRARTKDAQEVRRRRSDRAFENFTAQA
ncbi:MAG TPA: hypothetical protein VN285_00685, partial [Candidatus Deferrimicrobium sp.]|nr:hypothetical protein [Candidatus Deferrimicrobium sp.]